MAFPEPPRHLLKSMSTVLRYRQNIQPKRRVFCQTGFLFSFKRISSSFSTAIQPSCPRVCRIRTLTVAVDNRSLDAPHLGLTPVTSSIHSRPPIDLVMMLQLGRNGPSHPFVFSYFDVSLNARSRLCSSIVSLPAPHWDHHLTETVGTYFASPKEQQISCAA